jgi:hypothetical protein
MSKAVHRIYIGVFVLLVVAALVALIIQGFTYYNTPLEERFYHSDHDVLKPSGAVGHGLGIVGTLLILIGVSSYMIRKRKRSWRNLGVLKHWLEFHIFLCSLGPIMVLFHTAFKFGGIVSISFWSMVGVVLSGIIGRFIYIQIPRTMEGRELTLNEVRAMRLNVGNVIRERYQLPETTFHAIISSAAIAASVPGEGSTGGSSHKKLGDAQTLKNVRNAIREQGLSRSQTKEIVSLVKSELRLNRKIERLLTMQKLFRYWHVAHLPFAIIMLVIMVVHVIVTLTFGYRWIF